MVDETVQNTLCLEKVETHNRKEAQKFYWLQLCLNKTTVHTHTSEIKPSKSMPVGQNFCGFFIFKSQFHFKRRLSN